ncbi:hypothetical protein DTO027B5_6526 [Paecilomyces variotii]|nr:hypothetical protein DTO032I3_6953 [Paecilomyces variotii]KAJ9244094.1 hypothetical protein DTO169E5_2082 [Paecilomyces variotii]KAJ9263543.1 hypothetical protein DTO195F2_2803 [Paecilomyces variotii]KAJ9325215.1 hypothetical protein DTO027B3_3694 [Paecilomyces variotii]KAJ9331706.1 hypothetical protein DTO027B5_6526 [Paecilomyces variotii]
MGRGGSWGSQPQDSRRKQYRIRKVTLVHGPSELPDQDSRASLGFLAATGPRRIYSRLAGSGLGLAADDDDRSGRTVANTGEQPSWFFPAAGAPERAVHPIWKNIANPQSVFRHATAGWTRCSCQLLTPVEEYVDGRRLLI